MENIQRTTGKPFLPAYEKGIYNLNFVDGQSYNKKNDNEKDKGEINIKDLHKRYLNFRNKLFKDVPISKLYLYNTKDIESLSQKELQSLIEEGLNNEDWYVRKISAEMIQHIKNENIKEEWYVKLKMVIEKGLNDEDEDVRESSARMIQYIQDKNIKEDLYAKLKNIIEKGLNSEGIYVWIFSAKMIQYIKNKNSKKGLYTKLKSVIEKGLNSEDMYVWIFPAKMIQYIKNKNSKKELYEKLKGVIEKGLEDEDVNVRKISARMIQYIKNDSIKKELIEKGLDDEDVNVKSISARMIQYIKNDSIKKGLDIKLKEVIGKGLNDENVNARKSSAEMIQCVQDDSIKKELIEKGLDDEDVNVKSISARMIQYIKNDSIKKGLDIKLKEVIGKGLNDAGWYVKSISAGMIKYVQDDNIRKDLIEILKSKGLFRKYILSKKKSDHSLYKYKGNERIVFGNIISKIDKLVDNNHKNMLGKVYKRTTSLNPFLLQMKAFENYKIWKEVGLDHIPIETIYRFRVERDKDGKPKNNEISFFAKVYDDTLLNLENTDLYYTHQKEIEEQKRNILKGLEKLNIDHGDFFTKNICISWHRDKNNNPDFTKAPLLYLIDWDKATIKNML